MRKNGILKSHMSNKKILENFDEVLGRLRRIYKTFPMRPLAAEYRRTGRSVYEILIATILSLRTKDPVTYAASDRLFKIANNPEKMMGFGENEIAKAIFPVGFYKTKAKQILKISRILVEEYGGKVPSEREALLSLPGVGLKTANLVLAEGYGIPRICVDTHVHRISNRLDLIRTKTPEESEEKLHKIIPQKHWIEYPDLIVAYGQNVCVPVSPFCDSKCVIREFCPRRGVKKSR